LTKTNLRSASISLFSFLPFPSGFLIPLKHANTQAQALQTAGVLGRNRLLDAEKALHDSLIHRLTDSHDSLIHWFTGRQK